MITNNLQVRLVVIVACAAIAGLVGCHTAPTAPPQAETIHVIELADTESEPSVDAASGVTGPYRPGTAVDPAAMGVLEVGPHDSVVWLNATRESMMSVEVLGLFDVEGRSDAPDDGFELENDRATTREALAPGDAACLRFSTPGIYRYSIGTGEDAREGRIIVRED